MRYEYLKTILCSIMDSWNGTVPFEKHPRKKSCNLANRNKADVTLKSLMNAISHTQKHPQLRLQNANVVSVCFHILHEFSTYVIVEHYLCRVAVNLVNMTEITMLIHEPELWYNK